MKSVECLICALNGELELIDIEIKEHVQKHFIDLSALLSSVKGVGPTTIASLLADVPELGNLLTIINAMIKKGEEWDNTFHNLAC